MVGEKLRPGRLLGHWNLTGWEPWLVRVKVIWRVSPAGISPKSRLFSWAAESERLTIQFIKYVLKKFYLHVIRIESRE